MVQNLIPRSRTAWRLAGGLLLALAALAIFATSGEAATMSISGLDADGTIPQDGAVTITATAAQGEIFSPGDRAIVTTPFACSYGADLGAGTSATLTYPDDFTELAGGSECFDEANTWATASQDKAAYTVALDSENGGFSAPNSKDFVVRMTDKVLYERAERVTITAYGYNDKAVLDAIRPDGRKFSPQPIEADADGDGKVTFALDLDPGDPDDGDLGLWILKVIDISPSGITKKEDRGAMEVEPTSIVASWAVQPGLDEDTAVVPRMASTNAMLDLVYAGSIGHPDGALPVTFNDIESGELDLAVTTGASVYTASASFNQNLDQWQVNYVVGKTDDLATDYQIDVDVAADVYGNEILSEPSRQFAVVAAEVEPEGVVLSETAGRASTDEPLHASVSLRFPSGTAVTDEDVDGDGDLMFQLVRDGEVLTNPNEPLLAKYDGDGTWILEAALPRDLPLGTAEVWLVGPTQINTDAPDGNPNRVVIEEKIGDVEITAGEPNTVIRVLDQDEKVADTFLRGDLLHAEVDFTYGTGAPVTHNDVFGGTGQGRAFLRIMPNGDPDETFHVDLEYDPGDRNWFVDYVIPSNDPVGNWQVSAVMSDQWGNGGITQTDVRVGMDVDLSLSRGQVLRSEDIVISAMLSAPGDDTPLTGTVVLNVTGPGTTLVDDQEMSFDGQAYTMTVSVPAGATLGTYVVAVSAELAEDNGFASNTFEVVPASIAAVDKSLGDSRVHRLGELDFSFRLQYPNGDPVPSDGAAPTVRAVRTDASFEATLPVEYDGGSQAWKTAFHPSLSVPVGDYRFVVAGTDAAGNVLEDQFSSEFAVEPAQIIVEALQTQRLQYVRGASLDIRADAHYADGSIPQGLAIPVSVLAGSSVQGEALLVFDAAQGQFTGSFDVPFDAPLSNAATPWLLRIDPGTVVDPDGNLGPEFTVTSSQFSVAPAAVTVSIVEEPVNAVTRGADTLEVRFQLVSPDGSLITGNASGIRVLLLRDEQSIGNATVFAEGDEYVATLALEKTVRAGEYILRIGGVDANGNAIQPQETNAFQVLGGSGSDKGSPGLGPLALVGALVASIALRRRR